LKKYYIKFCATIIFLALINSKAFNQNKIFYIGASINYITEAKNFPFPNSSDITLKNLNFSTEDFFSYSLYFKYFLYENFFGRCDIEYLRFKAAVYYPFIFDNQNVAPKLYDDVIIVPVELSIGYKLPFSDETFDYVIGGGFGIYFSDMKREIGDIKSIVKNKKIFYGIQTYASVGAKLYSFLKTYFEMKFRDPELIFKNKFQKVKGIWNGAEVKVLKDEFYSKINVNGLLFSIGFEFSI